MPGNQEAWEIIAAGRTQVQVGGMGSILGFDYPAFKMLAQDFCIETPPAFWAKVRAVEDAMTAEQTRKEKSNSAKK